MNVYGHRFLSSVVAVVSAFVLLTANNADAVNYYWDINGATAGAGGAGAPSGSWDGVNTYWNVDSTGANSGWPDWLERGTALHGHRLELSPAATALECGDLSPLFENRGQRRRARSDYAT